MATADFLMETPMSDQTHIKFVQDYGVYQSGDVVDIEASGIGYGLAATFVEYRRAEWHAPKTKAVKGANVRNKAMSAAGGE